MAEIAYPIIPKDGVGWCRLLPTGGQSGGPCVILDGQGSLPSIFRPRVPSLQISEWPATVEYVAETSTSGAQPNGFEGYGIDAQLWSENANSGDPTRRWRNDLLDPNGSGEWETGRRSWETYSRYLALPHDHGADVLDIAFVYKAPSGQVKLSNLSLTTRFEREYPANVIGESDAISLVRQLRPVRVFQSTQTRQFWFYNSYLKTESTRIKAGETVEATARSLMGGLSDSDSDVPVYLRLDLKFRGTNGTGDHWVNVARRSSDEAVLEIEPLDGSVSFVAPRDFDQFEVIAGMATRFGRDHASAISHRGIRVVVQTRRALLGAPEP